MGATFSYLGYPSRQQPHPLSHEHISQQLHQGCGASPILGNEDAASPSIIGLYTRLTALEKDLEISRVGNTNKEAVIQYLLQSSVSNARFKETTVKLKEQLVVLKTTIDRINKQNDEIKDKLGRAEDTISALSTSSVLDSRSTSTSCSTRSDLPPKSDVVTEDLIDLMCCSQESDNLELTEDDTTLIDGLYEDESDMEGVSENTTPDQSLHQSSDADFEGSSYIVHFSDSDQDNNVQDAVKVSTQVLQ